MSLSIASSTKRGLVQRGLVTTKTELDSTAKRELVTTKHVLMGSIIFLVAQSISYRLHGVETVRHTYKQVCMQDEITTLRYTHTV